MSEPLVIRAVPAPDAWVLYPPADPWGDGYVAVMRVELHGNGLRASTEVNLSLPGDGSEHDLIVFFQGLADDWRGWAGVRTWRSLDGKLWIGASHDGAGHVALAASVRASAVAPDAWHAGVVVTIEAGEQMRQLVDDLRTLFNSSGYAGG
jgi:hypothetical protein